MVEVSEFCLHLPLRWEVKNGRNDVYLYAGKLLVGEVFCDQVGTEWFARGLNICPVFTTKWWPNKEQAMNVIEEAILSLGQ